MPAQGLPQKAHQGPESASTRSVRPSRSSSLCTATLEDQLDSPSDFAVFRHRRPASKQNIAIGCCNLVRDFSVTEKQTCVVDFSNHHHVCASRRRLARGAGTSRHTASCATRSCAILLFWFTCMVLQQILYEKSSMMYAIKAEQTSTCRQRRCARAAPVRWRRLGCLAALDLARCPVCQSSHS